MKSFEEFQQSKHLSTNLGIELSDARWEDQPPAHGFVYEGGLYIECMQDHWSASAKACGQYYLIIGCDEHISDDLEMLERRLYEFGISEEII